MSWISKHKLIFAVIIIMCIIFIILIIVLPIVLTRTSNSEDDSNVPDDGFISAARGCPVTNPTVWQPSNYGSTNGLIAIECNLSNDTVLTTTDYAGATYTNVFSANGKEIFDDIANGTNTNWWNYGDSTKQTLNNQDGCKNEPTGSLCTYVDTSSAIALGVFSLRGDSFKITSKFVATDQPRNSGRIHSQQSYIYGLHSFRIDEIPEDTQNTSWAAAWLVAPYACGEPGNTGDSINFFGPWPNGEIDIFEAIDSNSHISSALHVPCRNQGNSVAVSRETMQKQPGWYCTLWTPEKIQVYYIPLVEGDKIFASNNIEPNILQQYNTTAANSQDGTGEVLDAWIGQTLIQDEGRDVVDKSVNIDFETAVSRDWRVSGVVTPCAPSTNAPKSFENLYTDKKYNQFLGLGSDAILGGGNMAVLNVATSIWDYNNSIQDQVLGVSSYKVYQILEKK